MRWELCAAVTLPRSSNSGTALVARSNDPSMLRHWGTTQALRVLAARGRLHEACLPAAVFHERAEYIL